MASAYVFVAAMLIAVNVFAAADYAREKRWNDEITPTLVVGDAVYLAQPSGHKFLALYTQAAKPRAAVIIVHGLGVHPDWALIGALRSALPDEGYTTLSVQMPVLAADAAAEDYTALFTDSAERLTAAIAFLHSKSAHKIGLVSHSMGARISNYFLATNGGRDVDAWVSIGISSGEFANISNLKMPVLDIYGQQDFPVVRQNAYKRAATLRALKGSAQIEVPGADHYFAGHENELAKRIGQFLDQRLR